MGNIILEAPVFNVSAAIEAAQYGIDRIELCSNFPEGGETPSPGMLSFLKREIDIPIFVMIRPRGGDFCYSDKEVSIMKEDIKIHLDKGADGFVFGVLDSMGNVNSDACEALLRATEGLPCTFHRAFDASRNLNDSLEQIVSLGFNRILTSGGRNTVSEASQTLLELFDQAADRIIIMPGGGSKPEHIDQFSVNSFFTEIHASCKTWKKSANQFQRKGLIFSEEPKAFTHYLGVNEELVAEFKSKLI
ncbi:copper homeostasis protein CutC [Algoriphagus namhaensis]|uniref:PF03932 family protein CutC n=1 Tax=Algoriphagus namhaensis TaxID=915353 RepID=A0ABV8AN62_9BACT